MTKRRAPSFRGLSAASPSARSAAKSSSKKSNTKSEILLRRELWARGLRYRINWARLPGCPDIVFTKQRLAVFCDGDFWHGRDLTRRMKQLAKGHNSAYWTEKIRTNVERDRLTTRQLVQAGWRVLRLWETDILRSPGGAASQVVALLEKPRLHPPPPP